MPLWRDVVASFSGGVKDELGLEFHINYLLSTHNTLLPDIVSTAPFLRVRPRRPQDKAGAKTQQAALGWAMRETESERVLRQAASDCLMFNIGITKAEYRPSARFLSEPDFDSDDALPEGDDDTPEDARRVDAALAAAGISTAMGVPGVPTGRRVAPWDFLVPIGCASLSQCPWVAERVTTRLDDLRADGRFSVPAMMKPDVWLKDGIPSSMDDDDQFDGEPEYVRVYEVRYWSHTRAGLVRRVLWLLRSVPAGGSPQGAVLRHEDDRNGVSGYGYRVSRFVDVTGSFYGSAVADMANILDLSDLLNEEWTYLINHHRWSAIRKFITRSGMFEEDAMRRLIMSTVDGDVQEVDVPQGMSLNDVIAALPEAPPPSDTSFVLGGLKNLMFEMSGIDAFQRGAQSRKGTTAREASIVSAASSRRASVRRDEIEKLAKWLGRSYLEMIRKFWTKPVYLRITGSDGDDEFLTFSPDEADGMFDVDVVAGSTITTDESTEQSAFIGLLQTIREVIATVATANQTAIQAGQPPMFDQAAVQNFIDRAFAVWQEDKASFMGPLAALQSMPSRGGGGGGGQPAGGEGGGAPAPDLSGAGASPPGVLQLPRR